MERWEILLKRVEVKTVITITVVVIIAMETKIVKVETSIVIIEMVKVAKVDLLVLKLVKATKTVMAKIVKADLTKIKTAKAETLDVIETVKVDKVKAEIAETAKDDQTLEINKVVKVNVDEETELAAQYQIMSIPTLMVFKNGQITNQALGALPKHQILSLLEG